MTELTQVESRQMHLADQKGRNDLARCLWGLWRQGRQPSVEDFLADADIRDPDRIVAVLRVDQWERCRLGQRVPAEDYLDAFPAVRDQAEHAVELVLAEYLVREELGERPALEEYVCRFPQYAEALELQLLLHQAMAADSGPVTGLADGTMAVGTRCEIHSGASSERLPVIPGYEILGVLGRGGMGVVYRAWQDRLNRSVAVKMVHAGAQADPKVLSRFRVEAEAVARLQHPSIVQIHEVGQHAGSPYLVLELVDGRSLAEWLAGTPRPVRQAAELLETLARAVHYAHCQGVVHRDLTPANVLLTADGRPKISDFGLAKLIIGGGNLRTQTGELLGTPSYMAPEQADSRHQAIGAATDVYALGAILYELLTGRPPFKAESSLETLRQVVAHEPVAPSRLRPQLPGDLETICLKCLHKEPCHRYADAAALAEDLQRFLENRPIRARRVGAAGHAWRWGRRNPAVAGLGAAVFLAMALGMTVSTWQMFRARRAESEMRGVLEFVENRVLAAARPEGRAGGLGRAVTLRQAIDAALPAVAHDFADQPLVEARLRQTLGTSYFYLGDPARAAQQYEASRALYARHRGPDDPDTLKSMNNLASTYNAVGRPAEALKLHEQALALMKANLGPDHLNTLQTMNNLATNYYSLGRHAQALKLQEETLTLRKSKLGPDHPDTLASMNNLAASYYSLGRHAEALKLYEETLALQKANLGPDHPDTLVSMNNLAASYYSLGRHAEALKLHEQTLALRKSNLGPDHPDTLASMQNLANSYQAVGRRAEALKLHEETLTLMKAKLGPDHPDTLMSVHNVANSYAALGQHAEAIKFYEEAMTLRKAKLGPDHPETLTSMNYLANSYQALGRQDQALQLRRDTLALRQSRLGPDHPDTLASMHNLAISYEALDRQHEALQLRQESLALQKATLGADHPETLASMNYLANNYRAVGRNAEALKLKEATLALQKAKLGPDHPDTLMSMHGLANSYQNLGRPVEALHLYKQTLALRKVKLGPDHPDTLLNRIGVASCLVQLGRGAEAAADSLRAAEAWEKGGASDANSLYNCACFRAVSAAAVRAADRSPAGAKQAAAESDRSMAWLKRAVAAGFSSAATMAEDHDLDALRHRAEFKELLARVGAVRPK
jgi:tetratricopeptide (TPR) repeat protein